MFSRNLEKRHAENAAFLKLWNGMISGIRQFFNRLKNMKKYKYFKCPECKSRLRLPRGVGEVTVTCGKCHHPFKQKA
jgi:ribosomal protein L37AE/L43A